MCGRYYIDTDSVDEKMVALMRAMEARYPGAYKTGEIFPGDAAPGMIMIIGWRNDRDSIVSPAKRHAWPRIMVIIEPMITMIRPMILTRMIGQTGKTGLLSRIAAQRNAFRRFAIRSSLSRRGAGSFRSPPCSASPGSRTGGC